MYDACTMRSRCIGTGSDGLAGVFSFGGSKLLTAGRGGAVLFNDPQLFQRAKLWLHRGLQQWAPLSELQAAALRPQLAKLPAMNARRAENVKELVAALAIEPRGLTPWVAQDHGDKPRGSKDETHDAPAFYKLGFHYDAAAIGLSRELFTKAVRAEGIALDAGFKALHVGRSPSRFRAVGDLPNATAAHDGCVEVSYCCATAGGSMQSRTVSYPIRLFTRQQCYKEPSSLAVHSHTPYPALRLSP